MRQKSTGIVRGGAIRGQRSGIYQITCVASGKRYIGSAVDIRVRWGGHRRDLRRGRHANPHLQNAWTAHGEGAFTFEVVHLCRREKLLFWEQRFMNKLKPEFNAAPRAGSAIGVKRSKRFREKVSATMRQKSADAFATQLRNRAFSVDGQLRFLLQFGRFPSFPLALPAAVADRPAHPVMFRLCPRRVVKPRRLTTSERRLLRAKRRREERR